MVDIVKWNNDKVDVRPDIATNSLTNGERSFGDAEAVMNKKYVDTYYSTYDIVYAHHGIMLPFKKVESEYYVRYTADAHELQATDCGAYLIFHSDNLFNAFTLNIEVVYSNGMTNTRTYNYKSNFKTFRINREGTGSSIYYQSREVIDIKGYEDATIELISVTMSNSDVQLIIDEETDNIVSTLGISKAFVYSTFEHPQKSSISTYDNAHHENNMLVLPSIISTSSIFNNLLNSSVCLKSDFIINLIESYKISCTLYNQFKYPIERDNNYVLVWNEVATIKLMQRVYNENDEVIDVREQTINPQTASGNLQAYQFHANANSYIIIPNYTTTILMLGILKLQNEK